MSKEEQFVIYKITNLINGKVYIGQTNNYKRRIKEHRSDSKSKNYPIYRSIRKYGIENFSFEILEKCCSKTDLNDKEVYWISQLQSGDKNFGYNLQGGGFERVAHSDTIEKIRKANYSIKRNDGTKYKGVSAGGIGYNYRLLIDGVVNRSAVFRTEIEAAWHRDVFCRSIMSSRFNDIYYNFKDGKNKNLILEQLATLKMIETVRYNHGAIFYCSIKKRFLATARRIDEKNRKIIVRAMTHHDAVELLNKFIIENKSVCMERVSVVAMQRSYEKLHGSIYDLISDEELEEAYRTQLGTFE